MNHAQIADLDARLFQKITDQAQITDYGPVFGDVHISMNVHVLLWSIHAHTCTHAKHVT